MTKDIAPELLQQIQSDLDNSLKNNKRLIDLQKKIEKGIATYEDAQEYSVEIGELLSKAFIENLSSDILPDGKLYYNIANRILPPPIKKAYCEAAKYAGKLQESLNKKAGISIKNVSHTINEDRITKIVNIVSGKNNFDNISYMLQNPLINLCQSAVDMTVMANAEFQFKAGIKAVVTRYTDGKCCDWCSEVAGKYTYPDVPKDVYRRHKNCNCVVVYDPRDGGKVKDVHSKNEYNSTSEAIKAEYQKRIQNMKPLKKDPEKLKNVGMRKLTKKNPQELIEKANKNKAINQMNRTQLEEEARKVFIKRETAKGLSQAEAEHRFNSLIGSNTTPQVRQYLKKYDNTISKRAKNIEKSTKNGIINNKIDIYGTENKRLIPSEYIDWIGDNKYKELMASAEGEEAKKYVRTAYRKTSDIGDGGTADVRKFEIETGLNLGRNGRSHQKKVEDLIRQIEKSLAKDMSDKDRNFLKEELEKLRKVQE